MMPFDVYSDKRVVTSSQPVREEEANIQMQADHMIGKLMDFEQQSANDVVYNALKKRTQ